jgi:uncharacterized 2Fe-2S/4Fe-4S cluster protein (DUF4445 family)
MTYNIYFEPIGHLVSGIKGDTIYTTSIRSGISLGSICGGKSSCGRCKVRILSGRCSPITKNEKMHLSEEEIRDGYRLACIARILSDLKIMLPQITLAQPRLQLKGIEPKIEIDPVISLYNLKLSEPSLENPLPNWENIVKTLDKHHNLRNLKIDIHLLRDLNSIIQNLKREVSVSVRGNEIIGICNKREKHLGIAIDLGTTKIAAYLVDLFTGETLKVRGIVNPQIVYGEDIMTRISYAMKNGVKDLRLAVCKNINDLIRDFLKNLKNIDEIVIVGNTVMHHLLLGLPVEQLGKAPYVPVIRQAMDIKARDLGLNMTPLAYIHLLPNIAGFIGSDHVAMLLATEINKSKKNTIGIDIGTNTEVALSVKGEISSLSCASGPAFEGARIKHGMRAAKGAIEKVNIKNSAVSYKVIGDIAPIGICGSGILDIISQLRQEKIIDHRGRLQNHDLTRKTDNGQEFVLVLKNNSGITQDIVITQNDIGEIQLAKAAIRTGINILLNDFGITEEQIDQIIVAGAFGTFINIESAVRIGMLPSIPLNHITQVGNAAGIGAKLALISKQHRSLANKIANKVKYNELTIHPKFSHEFSHSLQIP